MVSGKKHGVVSLVDGNSTHAVNQTGDAGAIIDRLKLVIGRSSDSQLAEYLGITRQSISKARERNKVPDRWITTISEKTQTPTEFLTSGKGRLVPEGLARLQDEGIPELIEEVILRVEEALEDSGAKLSHRTKAKLISIIFSIAFQNKGKIDLKMWQHLLSPPKL